MTTTNFELENICQYFKLPLVCVCQKDELKQYQHVNNGFYIINNQSSTQGSGSHWTCLHLNKDTSFFFCSFGSPPSIEIVKYVRSFSKHFKNNNRIIQHLKSEHCGFYCIGFMLFMVHNNYNFFEFIKAFHEDETRNDQILEGIIRLYLPNKKIPKELQRFLSLKY